MKCINSIHQIVQKLLQNIYENAFSGDIFDIDSLAAETLENCKEASRELIQVIIEELNTEMREDKEERKALGLVMKEKNRKRELLTPLGTLKWERDYYFDRKDGKYVAPLDEILGVRNRERIGDNICADLVNHAAKTSYARSAEIVTDGAVSRQTVRNEILKLEVPENKPKCEGKEVKELHIYADEDHVHMQKPGKVRGKSNNIVPLVTVTEGSISVGTRRNKTVNAMYFVDENFDTKELWKSVEGYIAKAYDSEKLETICLHSDGGSWIKNGLENFTQTKYVMDGYHYKKALKNFARKFPKRNVTIVLRSAIARDDFVGATQFLDELKADGVVEEMQAVEDFEKYLIGNWSKIREREIGGHPGSCTEGQVSHVLAERFSRNPLGWSKAGLGKLSKIRVYILNGEDIKPRDFKIKEKEEKYGEYGERMINNMAGRQLDWSIFEKGRNHFDISSATQRLLRGYGELRNTIC